MTANAAVPMIPLTAADFPARGSPATSREASTRRRVSGWPRPFTPAGTPAQKSMGSVRPSSGDRYTFKNGSDLDTYTASCPACSSTRSKNTRDSPTPSAEANSPSLPTALRAFCPAGSCTTVDQPPGSVTTGDASFIPSAVPSLAETAARTTALSPGVFFPIPGKRSGVLRSTRRRRTSVAAPVPRTTLSDSTGATPSHSRPAAAVVNRYGATTIQACRRRLVRTFSTNSGESLRAAA